MQKQKGFTIIELIVVIAIIVILATIILININGYINKGKDAAVKEDMSTLLTDATNFYASSSSGSFAGVSSDPDYLKASTGITGGSLSYTLVTACDSANDCSGSSTKWCACIVEKASSTTTDFCVDSSGTRKEVSTSGTTCAAECDHGTSTPGLCK